MQFPFVNSRKIIEQFLEPFFNYSNTTAVYRIFNRCDYINHNNSIFYRQRHVKLSTLLPWQHISQWKM